MDITQFCNSPDNVILFVKDRLSNDQQKIFADNFLLSIIDKSTPYPIKGEVAMEWLGYSRKDHF